MKTPSFHDVEQLSALLDGKLSRAEAERIQARLQTEPALKALFDDLQETRQILRRVPRRKAPRNFTLTPQMAGVKPPMPRAFPALRFATALATFLLFFSVAANAVAPSLRQAAQAPAPAYGMGGGGAAEPMGPEAMPQPTVSTMMQTGPALPAGTLEPTLSASDQTRMAETPTPLPQPLAKQSPRGSQASGPVPILWEIVFLLAALGSAGFAWGLRSASERAWRETMK
jgi:hypothetical protein